MACMRLAASGRVAMQDWGVAHLVEVDTDGEIGLWLRRHRPRV